MGQNAAIKSGKGGLKMGKSKVIGEKNNKGNWVVKVEADDFKDLLMFLAAFLAGTYNNIENQDDKNLFMKFVSNVPSVFCGQDFTDREIITCCECEYGETWYSGYYCKKMDTLTDNRATDFCSRAKKKEIKKGKEKDRQ